MTELELYAVASTLVDTSNSSARVLLANLRGFGNTGEDGQAEAIEQCEVIFPYGFASRPAITQHTEALCSHYGDQMICLAIFDKSAVDISSLEEGEVRLQNASGANERLRNSGKVELNSAGGQDIVLNGGTKKIARVDDTVAQSIAFAAWMSAVSTASGVAPMLITDKVGQIDSGANNAKA